MIDLKNETVTFLQQAEVTRTIQCGSYGDIIYGGMEKWKTEIILSPKSRSMKIEQRFLSESEFEKISDDLTITRFHNKQKFQEIESSLKKNNISSKLSDFIQKTGAGANSSACRRIQPDFK